MGACCSKDVDYRNRQMATMYEKEEEEENHVFIGDYGASIRLQGSSAFVSMTTQQGKKGINQDAMTVWEVINYISTTNNIQMSHFLFKFNFYF